MKKNFINKILSILIAATLMFSFIGMLPVTDACSCGSECNCSGPVVYIVISFDWNNDCGCCSTPVIEKPDIIAENLLTNKNILPRKNDLDMNSTEDTDSSELNLEEQRDKIPKTKFLHSTKIFIITSSFLI
ncbi:MAG: hypothetical protein GY863_17440 [bacterium]|nr:hypothetical protein [bacterium]